jgi:hypothetical protein
MMQGGPDEGALLEGLDLVRALVRLVDHNARTPGLVALFTVLSAEATSSEHPAHAYFHRRYVWVHETVREAFVTACARGEVRLDVDPGSATRSLTSLMDGLQVQWLFDPTIDMAGEVRRYVQSLITVEL